MTTAFPPGPLGILGGTFDPIHLGHLRLGQEALQQLGLSQIRFIPAGRPPLRDSPCASAQQRLAMVKLAIAGNPEFVVDDSEALAATQSYTVDTLTRLRTELGPQRAMVLLLGGDAFARLESWQRWTEIFSLAHVAVATRPDSANSTIDTKIGDRQVEYTPALAREFQQRLGTVVDIAKSPSGRIFPFTIPALEISATAIRQQIKSGRLPRYLVAEAVVRYIELNHLYR